MTLADRAFAALLSLPFALLRALGPVRASNLGGAIARTIGPQLPVSRIARINLAAALPQLDQATRDRVVRDCWDNLGRTVAELPHMDRLHQTPSGPGWELITAPESQGAERANGAIYVAAHLANWEIIPALARALGAGLGIFYRAAANQTIDAMVRDLRSRAGGPTLQQFPKGASGSRLALSHLRRGGVLGMLADQKTNDGIQAEFFGHQAMTASAPAALALRFDIPLIPTRVERLGPARLRVTIEAPLPKPDTGNRQTDIALLTTAINHRMERWISERPGEWLWLHRRWPKPWYKG